MSSEVKRMYRSRDERMIAGVCGGIAKYFSVDPTLIRLLFVIFGVGAGSGVLAYIILMIILPEEPTDYVAPSSAEPASTEAVETDESA